MLKSNLVLAGAAVAVSLSFFGGWKVRDLQADAAEIARKEEEQKQREMLSDLADEIKASLSESIASIRIENKTIYNKATHEIQRETVYADCVLPDAGRVLANEARAAANARGGTMPAPADAK